MVSHDDMTALFGKDNILTVTSRQLEELNLSAPDAEALATVGLPRHDPPLFTTDVEGGPEFLLPIDIPERDHREVIIGGPPGDAAMRFSLDANEGFVTLVHFGRPPRIEVVNRDLGELIEFLYLIKQHQTRTTGNASGGAASVQELSKQLRSMNPVVFERQDLWWPIALHHLDGKGVLDLLV